MLRRCLSKSIFCKGGYLMFEEKNLCLDEMLGILAIQKIRYDHLGICDPYVLDEDYLFEACYEALPDVASKIEVSNIDFEETTIHKICFPSMKMYYKLCREYGKKHNISFKKNKFVEEAEDFVNSEMCEIDSYFINWCLFTPKSEIKKRYPCLLIFTAYEFCQVVQFIEALYNIRSFYEDGVKILIKELSLSNEKIIDFSNTAHAEERKQAA